MIDEIRAELVWYVSASEILVIADSNYFVSCTFTKPYPLCQLQAARWTRLRQLGYTGKPTKECLRVCRAVQFFYPTTMRCQFLKSRPSLSGSASSSGSTSKVCFSPLWPNVYASVGPFVQFLNITEIYTTLSSIFSKNFL